MKLYVIRHASAVDSIAGMPDELRPLTDEGRDQFARVVRGLRALDVRFDLLLHSPLLRALETAELCAPLLLGESEVTPMLAQAPGPELLALLRHASVALVGHEPWVSELVAWMLTENRELSNTFGMKKGAVAVLEGDPKPGQMRLIGFYPPSALREIGS
jgi:phosphohistidine phosphatase